MKKQSLTPLHGFLPIRKPPDCTSFDVIRRIKPLCRKTKIGHAGTLDPMATGLLTLCLGQATKLVRFLPNKKRYRAVVRLGEATDTLDRTGTIVSQAAIPTFDEKLIEDCLESFRGEITQTPPMFSALHHEGKRLYELARQGQEAERKLRTVRINSLELLAFGKNWLEIDVSCTSGTYIRSLAFDIAVKLGCVGHLTQLERTSCSGWDIDQAHALQDLLPLDHTEFSKRILPIEHALGHLKRIDVPQEIAVSLSMGRKLSPSLFDHDNFPPPNHFEPFWLYPPGGSPIAMVQWHHRNTSTEIEILRILDIHQA